MKWPKYKKGKILKLRDTIVSDKKIPISHQFPDITVLYKSVILELTLASFICLYSQKNLKYQKAPHGHRGWQKLWSSNSVLLFL